MDEHALIVAGGSGNRMQSSLPKQFIELLGLPILIHTINAFIKYSKEINIVIVLPEKQFDQWHKLVDKHSFKQKIQLVNGGASRNESVRNGLESIKEGSLVAIHDGVRPLVSVDTIRKSFTSAKNHGSGIAAVEPKDSLRKLTQDCNKAVDRNDFRIIQTPQTFKLSIIKEAYSAIKNKDYTDDASVAEANGHNITLVEGDYRNIKITTPEDILIAQALLDKN